jgi:hypothetical protein
MKHTIPARRERRSEEGYLLVWVMFMLAVFTIWLSVAVPRAAKEIQRDRDVETMRRGKQYTRAIQLYYRKFHAYPPNANALVNTNEIRFLRKKYIDPVTRKDDWKPIRFGEAKTQSTGFFGQPIAGAGSAGGSVLAGVGPSGSGGLGGSSATGSTTGSSLGGSTFGGSSIFGSGNTPGSNGSAGTTTANGSAGASGAAGASGTTGTSSANGSSDSSSAFGSSSGQTFGGAGIIGFSPASTQTSILILKKKQHYNEWEFVYDLLNDKQTQAGGNMGQPASSTTTPVGSSSFGGSSGTGSSTGSSFGSGFGSTPSPAPGSGATPQSQQ